MEVETDVTTLCKGYGKTRRRANASFLPHDLRLGSVERVVSPVRRASAALMLAAVLLGSLIAFADAGDPAPPAATRSATGAARHLPLSIAVERRPALDGLDPLVHELRDGRLVAALPGGRRAELTLDPGLQSRIERLFARHQKSARADWI
jgi:hypothetical protein